MAMNDKQEKKATESVRKPRGPKKNAEEAKVIQVATDAEQKQSGTQTFTAEDVQRMIAEALAKQAENLKPQVIQVMSETEKVILRFQAEVADDNVTMFGAGGYYGQITGKAGLLTVPKSEFTSRFLDDNARWMLKNRWLVVLSGLDEQERELYGVNYREGEYMDELAFLKMLDMTEQEILELFPKLCLSYREMVAHRFVSAYMAGDARVSERRGLVKKLNDMSKEDYKSLPENDVRRKGSFAIILEEMNRKDV